MSENQVLQKTKEEWLEQGIALLKARKYREALKACEYASQLDPACSRAYHGMGLIYTQMKDYRKAFDAYTRAVQLDPDNPKIAFHLREFYFTVKDYERAQARYKKAIKLNPIYWPFYITRIQSLVDNALLMQIHKDEYSDKAITMAFKNVLSLDPNNTQALSFFTELEKINRSLKELFLMNVLVFTGNTLRLQAILIHLTVDV